MPKKFFVAAMMIFFAAENFCAAMPASEMFLGGFTIGSSYHEMVKVYGEPDCKKIGAHKTAYCYFHKGNDYGFFILFNKESGKILQLELHGGERGMANFEDIYPYIMKHMIE